MTFGDRTGRVGRYWRRVGRTDVVSKCRVDGSPRTGTRPVRWGWIRSPRRPRRLLFTPIVNVWSTGLRSQVLKYCVWKRGRPFNIR